MKPAEYANTLSHETEIEEVDLDDPIFLRGQARRAVEASIEHLYEVDTDMAHRISTAAIVRAEMKLWRSSRS